MMRDRLNVFKVFADNVSPGSHYLPECSLPSSQLTNPPVKVLAFYLPQFHEVPENDVWWGPGFTEWTNVTKAVPRYSGQIQPRLPADLGFYNLSKPEVWEKQSNLISRAGLSGVCIHNYWFNGKKLLEKPLDLLLSRRDIQLNFCLNWANESWSRRWDGSEEKILIQQIYDPNNKTGYIQSVLPALEDDRYIRINGRPLIMVYRPAAIPDPKRFFDTWREFLVRKGYGDPYLVAAQTYGLMDPRPFGMDAGAGFPPHGPDIWSKNDRDSHKLLDRMFVGHVRDYDFLKSEMLGGFTKEFVCFPGVTPSWDNEARKPQRGLSFFGANPHAYATWLKEAAEQVSTNNTEAERIVFVNAWNEWAEGAILEPDRHFGFAYLAKTRQVLDAISYGKDYSDYHHVQRHTKRLRSLFNKANRKIPRSELKFR